jgi:hypothetical protein
MIQGQLYDEQVQLWAESAKVGLDRVEQETGRRPHKYSDPVAQLHIDCLPDDVAELVKKHEDAYIELVQVDDETGFPLRQTSPRVRFDGWVTGLKFAIKDWIVNDVNFDTPGSDAWLADTILAAINQYKVIKQIEGQEKPDA